MHSQIIEDTIYLKFKNGKDYIKKDDGRINFYLENEVYQEEKAKYVRDMKEIDKDSLYPPNFHFPVKPNEYYQFYLNKHNRNFCESLKIDDLIFYNRSKIKDLSPYKNLIVILRSKNESIECYPVSFYKNVRE